ncbi:bifunctional phosphopantothenoylcysteine decarboxylase/phosphopantothenate--cysteine ligase CoaBC [Thiohalobacter thiocyanaticus]|uniref:Coenzyme A biosynthesis bifunctional protein CoaBC n=1 Tax=Thiohalobacter thiocyanaticus TaxID=585455 RepID=A0A426QK90_9GAMM|nr:bifunctional phosphopantothenoylcysteine decarboxylase/phosphopantothenate--cysteine ligase CoaBC [Thiohalobacter thiocyanaticus]RRQ22171.1 bifunctional phosphopantothenoylcysteine decarboxylase/phosphopantothenate--cysteine ligase CoaBC [Thiohalobacter thiocyanaticus]
MQSLTAKRILLGVSGGIAAYKSAELVRGLRAAGAEVRVVMTAGARRFITPLTLQALSGQPVRTELFDAEAEAGMDHIELARWADAVLVAPASADLLARLAQGRADDLLATLCLATRAPLLLAPAMNQAMWSHPATVANVRLLAGRGVRLLGPETGEQACGETGPGRMREPQDLITDLAGSFETGSLAGCRVLVTAGPTREAIDPVRFVSNRSSGRMGYAVAAAAREAGARVTLVSGPVALDGPAGIERVMVETAEEMRVAVQAHLTGCDIFIGAAAVADYRPAQAAAQKLKKHNATLSLDLVRNPDILAEVARAHPRPFTVGFAAETEDLDANARTKRMQKSLDMIAANRVGPGQGFDVGDNALTLYWEGGSESLPHQSKTRLARELIARIAQRFHDAPPSDNTKASHAQKGSAQGSG